MQPFAAGSQASSIPPSTSPPWSGSEFKWLCNGRVARRNAPTFAMCADLTTTSISYNPKFDRNVDGLTTFNSPFSSLLAPLVSPRKKRKKKKRKRGETKENEVFPVLRQDRFETVIKENGERINRVTSIDSILSLRLFLRFSLYLSSSRFS